MHAYHIFKRIQERILHIWKRSGNRQPKLKWMNQPISDISIESIVLCIPIQPFNQPLPQPPSYLPCSLYVCYVCVCILQHSMHIKSKNTSPIWRYGVHSAVAISTMMYRIKYTNMRMYRVWEILYCRHQHTLNINSFYDKAHYYNSQSQANAAYIVHNQHTNEYASFRSACLPILYPLHSFGYRQTDTTPVCAFVKYNVRMICERESSDND